MWVLFFHTHPYQMERKELQRKVQFNNDSLYSSPLTSDMFQVPVLMCHPLSKKKGVTDWRTPGYFSDDTSAYSIGLKTYIHIHTYATIFFFLNHFKSFCFQVMNRHLRFHNRNFLFCIRSTFVIVFFYLFPPCFLRRLSPTGNSPIWDIEMTEVSSTVESTHSKVKLKENPCHTSQRQGRCDESLKSG